MCRIKITSYSVLEVYVYAHVKVSRDILPSLLLLSQHTIVISYSNESREDFIRFRPCPLLPLPADH